MTGLAWNCNGWAKTGDELQKQGEKEQSKEVARSRGEARSAAKATIREALIRVGNERLREGSFAKEKLGMEKRRDKQKRIKNTYGQNVME